MKIALLGWDISVRDPGALPLETPWQPDGPTLWIEFSRIDRVGPRAGCLRPVVDERHGCEVTVHHALSQRRELPAAVSDLAAREGLLPTDMGFMTARGDHFSRIARGRHPKSCERIRNWILAKQLDAAVWTALPPRFNDALRVQFAPAIAVNYVVQLAEPAKSHALDAIRQAPAETSTAFRRLLAAEATSTPPNAGSRPRGAQ